MPVINQTKTHAFLTEIFGDACCKPGSYMTLEQIEGKAKDLKIEGASTLLGEAEKNGEIRSFVANIKGKLELVYGWPTEHEFSGLSR